MEMFIFIFTCVSLLMAIVMFMLLINIIFNKIFNSDIKNPLKEFKKAISCIIALVFLSCFLFFARHYYYNVDIENVPLSEKAQGTFEIVITAEDGRRIYYYYGDYKNYNPDLENRVLSFEDKTQAFKINYGENDSLVVNFLEGEKKQNDN